MARLIEASVRLLAAGEVVFEDPGIVGSRQVLSRSSALSKLLNWEKARGRVFVTRFGSATDDELTRRKLLWRPRHQSSYSLDVGAIHLHERVIRLKNLPDISSNLSTELSTVVIFLDPEPSRSRLERREERRLVKAEKTLKTAKDDLTVREWDQRLLSTNGSLGWLDVEFDDVSQSGTIGSLGPERTKSQ